MKILAGLFGAYVLGVLVKGGDIRCSKLLYELFSWRVPEQKARPIVFGMLVLVGAMVVLIASTPEL